jgi:hypothetical protein
MMSYQYAAFSYCYAECHHAECRYAECGGAPVRVSPWYDPAVPTNIRQG